MSKHLFCCLAALILLAGCARPCEAASVPELGMAMQEQYGRIQSLRANFTQSLRHQESGAVERRSGVLSFQRPLRFRWEVTGPEPDLIVFTEQQAWHYQPQDRTAYRYSPELAGDTRALLQVLTGQSRLDRDYSVRETGREGSLVILTLYPNEPTSMFTEGRLWINEQTKYIQRVEITDFYGNKNDIVLSDIAVNTGFPPSTFEFSPPAGVRVEDRSGSPAPI